MKRAKIMLMSIAVLATVGTALAFKVAKKGTKTYCYLKTTVQPSASATCPNQIDFALGAGTTNIQYYYTTLASTATDCSQQTNCTQFANRFDN
jgi:hypothetical protein